MTPALRRFFGALCLITLAAPHAAVWSQPRPRIDKAADLPRFTYRIDGKVEDLVRNADRFAPLAASVRGDTQSILAGYEIADKATQRDLLTQLALLDFLEGNYESALARAEQVRELEDKPAAKLMSLLRLRAAATAARAHALDSEGFRQAVADFLRKELAAMPFATVANQVRELRASAELIGETLIVGPLREVLQPIVDANKGSLSSEFSGGLVNSRYALLVALPLKQTVADTLGRYLATHQVTKSDIWAGREVELGDADGKAPVYVAIWDSGVDTTLFRGRVVRYQGKPVVIAHDKYSRRSSGELQPIPAELQSRLPSLKARTKGMSDLQSNIDSAEASEVKRYLSALPADRYKAAVEELGLVGNYVHGTHVAGIAMAGNPHARLLVARIEFGHTLKPDPCPSLEGARREALAVHNTVNWLKGWEARVINMSWGGNVTSIEGELEQCGIGATPDARKALAREIFDIGKKALTRAISQAPQVLFVTAAGNSGDDATFTESIPAGIVLPNLLTVGAVDIAGDEAPFTSYGPTVKLHANGYQVTSLLPGGEQVALSGTSMAAPQVAGLAAKMLAVNPRLTPPKLIELMVQTADRTPDGRRTLVHSRRAVEAARAAP